MKIRKSRKSAIVMLVCGVWLLAAPSTFAIAITNPANGTCHEAVTPDTFKGNVRAMPENPGGRVGPWEGVFNSSGNSAITDVWC